MNILRPVYEVKGACSDNCATDTRNRSRHKKNGVKNEWVHEQSFKSLDIPGDHVNEYIIPSLPEEKFT
jgi:hypothetical protein